MVLVRSLCSFTVGIIIKALKVSPACASCNSGRYVKHILAGDVIANLSRNLKNAGIVSLQRRISEDR